MKIKHALILAAASLCSQAFGADTYRSVKIIRTDGTTMIVDGERGLTARFAGKDLHFEAEGWTLMSVAMEDVKGWELTQEPSMTDEFGMRISYQGGRLQVAGVPDGTRLTIHDLSGVQMASGEVRGVYRLDLNAFPTGVYLVACGGKHVKIYKR